MATIFPIAYNTGSTIPGTEQIGDLAIGTTAQDYSSNIGGVKWWSSPDLDLQYIIGYVDLSGTHPNPISFVPCHIGFWGSGDKTENSFVNLCNFHFNQGFTNGNDAKVWLNSNGYWTNFETVISNTPTPTPLPTDTPTPLPTDTPTPTPVPVSGNSLLMENGDDLLQENGDNLLLDVLGYSFNLVDSPYNFPSSGNSIMNDPIGNVSGSTEINLLATTGRGFYFNKVDSESIDRISYYSGFTGHSVTITLTQNGSTAIYSGDTNSFKFWTTNYGDEGFVFGTNIGIPPTPTPNGVATLIQAAPTPWVIGDPVYVSLEIT